MKRLMALVMLMLLLPALACAQGLDAGLEQALGQVDLAPLETAAREDNLRVYLLRLAKGEMIWDARQVLDTLLRRLYGEARSSFLRQSTAARLFSSPLLPVRHACLDCFSPRSI